MRIWAQAAQFKFCKKGPWIRTWWSCWMIKCYLSSRCSIRRKTWCRWYSKKTRKSTDYRTKPGLRRWIIMRMSYGSPWLVWIRRIRLRNSMTIVAISGRRLHHSQTSDSFWTTRVIALKRTPRVKAKARTLRR